MPDPRVKAAYRRSIIVFGAAFIGLGVAMIAVTAARGGGVGLVLGLLFVGLGAGRLFLLRKR